MSERERKVMGGEVVCRGCMSGGVDLKVLHNA